jgi:hypothetical protein
MFASFGCGDAIASVRAVANLLRMRSDEKKQATSIAIHFLCLSQPNSLDGCEQREPFEFDQRGILTLLSGFMTDTANHEL